MAQLEDHITEITTLPQQAATIGSLHGYTGVRAKFKPDAILIEDKGSGTALIQELSATGSLRPIPINPKGEKEQRMFIQAAKVEAGQVYLPREAAWLSEFLLEVLALPRGRHDDQVDSLSQFLLWAGESVL